MYAIWDIPTRLFHWLLVIAVFFSWLSHEYEWYDVHLWSGYSVMVLVSFRIIWGGLGSVHSRFSDFVRGPRSVWAYLSGSGPARPGHNPAGGWSVLVLLLLLFAQAGSGLFNSDGLLFEGPLYHALDSSWTDKLGAWHEYLFWGLCSIIALHVLAVCYYQLGKHQNLIGPMFTGGLTGSEAPVPLWRAILVVALCAGALALAVYLAPEPDLPW